MPSVKTKPELVRANGSHWLELGGYSEQQSGEAFKREELYPVLELEVSRAGRVRAQFSCDRYTSSNGTMGAWRVILREIRTATPDEPYQAGGIASGIGPATSREISEACEPIIRAWLESDDYRASRRSAAAAAVVRELEAPAGYTLQRGRDALERTANELEVAQAGLIRKAIGQLAEAREALESLTI